LAVGRRWAQLAPERRVDVVSVLKEIDAAGLTLRRVWNAFRKGVGANVAETKPLSEAITELIKAKTAANRRPAYVTSLEQYLTRWAKGQEAKPLATVKLGEVEDFINGLPSLSSRATAINRLSTLFSFAVRKGWIGSNPCERIERPTIDNGTPTILRLSLTAPRTISGGLRLRISHLADHSVSTRRTLQRLERLAIFQQFAH
jgi:hypothetical protein